MVVFTIHLRNELLASVDIISVNQDTLKRQLLIPRGIIRIR